MTHGDTANAAYFILEGQAAAGVPEGDSYRGLATMREGDFFGEIAALTGSPRTADVVADRPTTLMEVPAEALRAVMVVPEINRLVLNTLAERLVRTNLADLPRLAANDQRRCATCGRRGRASRRCRRATRRRRARRVGRRSAARRSWSAADRCERCGGR